MTPARRLRSIVALCRFLSPGADGALPPARAAWGDVVAVAADHLLVPALWVAVRDRSPEDRCPPDALRLMRARYRTNAARNALLRRQVGEIAQVLNERGIEPLLLKGGTHLFSDAFDRGARYMGDLDVLVPAGRFWQAVDGLRELGYVPKQGNPRDFAFGGVAHDLQMIREDRALVDLHVEVGGPAVARILPAGSALSRSVAVDTPAFRARALCATDQVLHNVAHSELQDDNHAVGGLALRQLHTLAVMAHRWGSRVDWADVAGAMGAAGALSALGSYVYLAHRLFAMPVPAGIGGGPGPALHAARALAYACLGWPENLERNMRMAFATPYMEARYRTSGRAGRAVARVRHAAHVLRTGGLGAAARAAMAPRSPR